MACPRVWNLRFEELARGCARVSEWRQSVTASEKDCKWLTERNRHGFVRALGSYEAGDNKLKARQ